MDSPWDETADQNHTRDSEWTKISEEFTNVGYREGITAGKESALQEGFDSGFADVGAPLGQELGILRGLASAFLSFLSSSPPSVLDEEERQSLIPEAREISARLSGVRFTDIAPRDLEAEAHAREHLESEGSEMEVNDGLAEKRKMEGIEDMLAQLSAGTGGGAGTSGRLTVDDVRGLKVRLEALTGQFGLLVPANRS